VTVQSADVTQNSISVKLEGPSSGTLKLELMNASGVFWTIREVTRAPGTYAETFDLDNIPNNEYTQIRATWNAGAFAQTTYSYHIKVLGIFHHTQYNVPAEESCSGGPQDITVWDSSCHGTDTTVRSGFDFRVTNPQGGTGSGHSINYADVQQEFSCSVGSGDLRGWATIHGTLGSLDNTTVAACSTNPDLYVANRRVFIRGQGVKTVTDRCPACCQDVIHLDNFSTDTRCSGLTSLPDALTIVLY
jgi:hypothetical protein